MIPENKLLRLLLFPLSLLFGLGVAIKNFLYRIRFFNSVQFSLPVIGIGNLSVGGAGKTPHVEYLIRLLRPYLHTSVMSRGFGRKTHGFMVVAPGHQSDMAGDEPLIYARKYRDVLVSVSESRSLGIPQLLQYHPEVQVILLDDAFQHRSVSPHLNILLFEYRRPFYRDWLLPSGSLREWPAAYRRADTIIATKCPPGMTTEERNAVLHKLRPLPHQRVFFSTYRYHHPYAMYASNMRFELSEQYSVLLVCGIANTDDILEYVQSRAGLVDLMSFGDHYAYQEEDIELIATRFQNLHGAKKVILTTEKDAVRFEKFGQFITSKQLPLFLLPIEVVFLFEEGNSFDQYIRQFLLDFKV